MSGYRKSRSINQSIILHEEMSGCQLRIKSRSASQLQPSLLFPIPKALRFISPRSLGAGIRGLFRTEMFHLDVLVRRYQKTSSKRCANSEYSLSVQRSAVEQDSYTGRRRPHRCCRSRITLSMSTGSRVVSVLDSGGLRSNRSRDAVG